MISVLLNCLYLSSVCLPYKFYALLRILDRSESWRVFKLHLSLLFKFLSFMGHNKSTSKEKQIIN